jgi:hypothetical protein
LFGANLNNKDSNAFLALPVEVRGQIDSIASVVVEGVVKRFLLLRVFETKVRESDFDSCSETSCVQRIYLKHFDPPTGKRIILRTDLQAT